MVRQISDGDDTGQCLGQSATDLVSFHGADPTDQLAVATLATAGTLGNVITAVQAILAGLKEKGLMASS